MDDLINALVEALNSADLDGKFGHAKRATNEDADTLEIEYDGEPYYLDIVPG